MQRDLTGRGGWASAKVRNQVLQGPGRPEPEEGWSWIQVWGRVEEGMAAGSGVAVYESLLGTPYRPLVGHMVLELERIRLGMINLWAVNI